MQTAILCYNKSGPNKGSLLASRLVGGVDRLGQSPFQRLGREFLDRLGHDGRAGRVRAVSGVFGRVGVVDLSPSVIFAAIYITGIGAGSAASSRPRAACRLGCLAAKPIFDDRWNK